MNEKYELLDLSLEAMNKEAFNLLIVKGEAGMGKTHTILKFLKDKEIDFAYIKTYATPLKFYELLYKNRNKKVIVFDDLSSLGKQTMIEILKSACWNVLDESREISYYTNSSIFEKLNLPEKFKIKASLILIFNNKLYGFEPIISRGVSIDFNFSFNEKIDILNNIKEGVVREDIRIDEEIITYVKKSCSEATKNLSIRTLVILSTIKKKGFKWRVFANEMLKTDRNIKLLLKLTSKHKKLKDACDEWMEQTGKSRSTFMRTFASIKEERDKNKDYKKE